LSVDEAELLGEVQRIYREVSGSLRVLRPEDLLSEDLDIDSLIATEMLVALEDRYDIELIGDSRTVELRSVEDLIALVKELRATGQPSTVHSPGEFTAEADGRR
jgi:acyl carrier protein